ncbi:RNI-like protein [Boletus coccyginus]|nr:RNI-like protein [Boletus coccyginus]
MSRRGNNVRGPTSALTEFLRESGINPATIARRAATRNQPQGQNTAESTEQGGSVDQDDHADPVEDETATPAAQTCRRRRRQALADSGYASDQLDEAEEESPVKKRKGAKGKGTAAAKSKAKKKAKEDGEYEGSSEDEYTAISKNLWSMGGSGDPKPPVGSFEECVRCEKQFTVTKYTLAANPPPGYLCHQCAKASGADPFKKPAASKKRKPASEKREVINFEQRRFPTLACLCIELIGTYIDDVEALGDIGSVNMDEIAKTLARNRSLTSKNAHLFYDVQNKKLRFYDATNLAPPALTTLASLNPNLTHLHLDFCGRLTCPVITVFSESLPNLTHLSLLGPFLVRAEAWIGFFKAKPELRSFRITQSPRFDLECVKSLAKNCAKLEELQLKEVGHLGDTFVEPLCALPPLKFLDLSNPGASILEDGWVRILERHGPRLESFDPSWHEEFTDAVLENGIRKHARAISELRLEGLSSLSDEGVAHFFENWDKPFATLDSEDSESEVEVDECGTFTPNPPLRTVSLARNCALSSATFTALLAHSASSLVSLNLNGLGAISSESLGQLKDVLDVRWLDMSWCRDLDDFMMKDVVSNAPKLSEVRVWGCNRVRGTGWAGKRGLKVYGIEPNAGS